MAKACIIGVEDVQGRGVEFLLEHTFREMTAVYKVDDYYMGARTKFTILCNHVLKRIQKDFPNIERNYKYCKLDSGQYLWDKAEEEFDFVEGDYSLRDEKDLQLCRNYQMIEYCDYVILFVDKKLAKQIEELGNKRYTHPNLLLDSYRYAKQQKKQIRIIQ